MDLKPTEKGGTLQKNRCDFIVFMIAQECYMSSSCCVRQYAEHTELSSEKKSVQSNLQQLEFVYLSCHYFQ